MCSFCFTNGYLNQPKTALYYVRNNVIPLFLIQNITNHPNSAVGKQPKTQERKKVITFQERLQLLDILYYETGKVVTSDSNDLMWWWIFSDTMYRKVGRVNSGGYIGALRDEDRYR